MSKTVIAVFDSMGQARKAVQVLSETGLVSERIQVQTGEEFIARAHEPAPGRASLGMQDAVARFASDIGLAPEDRSRERGTEAPLSADDAVIVLEAADDRAEETAAILDRYGAIDVDERRVGRRPLTPEGTPPRREAIERYNDVDERSLVAGAMPPGRGRTRIYAGH